ncbi:MAG: hypothetical protein PUP93_09490 [Rhizonema sp. NSF051]|nr:hypothetical protein [Rhizonema sp. NSF051]
MRQLLVDKSSIPDKTSTGHIDSPGLWIAIILGSVALHLLLFWWMYAKVFTRFQQHSSSVTPIELVDISPKSHSKTRPQSRVKRVSPNLRSTTRRSVSASLPKQVTQPKQVTPENLTKESPLESEDGSAIAFAKNKKAITSQHHTVAVSKKTVKKTAITAIKDKLNPETIYKSEPKPPKTTDTPKRVTAKILTKTPVHQTFEPTPLPKTPVHKHGEPKLSSKTPIHKTFEPTPSSQTSVNRKPIVPSPQTPLSQQDPLLSSQQDKLVPTPDTTASTNTPSTTPSSPETSEQPPSTSTTGSTIRLPGQPQEQVKVGEATSLDKKGGGLVVGTWEVEPSKVDIQDSPAKPIGNLREKLLNFPGLSTPANFPPKDFQASLVIDDTGKLQLIIIDPHIPEPQSSQYHQYVQELFQDEKFIPATNADGKKPSRSNLLIRIKIRRR